MKIKSIKVEGDGLTERKATDLWDKIEKFAAYSFNKSHSVEYSIISYWSMWTKVYYPAQFYAASLSILGEDKLKGIVADARDRNIYIAPPDVNLSADQFQVAYDAVREQTVLITPFSRVKGISEASAKRIAEVRERIGGKFESLKHFAENVPGRSCNSAARERLMKIGAFANVEPGQLPARHPDRLKDQVEYIPGLIVDLVKSDRKIEIDKFIGAKIITMVNEYRACEKCSLKGKPHPSPKMGSSPKVMVITDCPTWHEDEEGELMTSKSGKYVKVAMKEAGLTMRDMYFTTMVKAKKSDKMLANEQINGCYGYLERELELLKPPVIVALGGAIARKLLPDLKGGYLDIANTVVFDSKLDASIIVGINPATIFHHTDHQEILNETFRTVASIIT